MLGGCSRGTGTAFGTSDGGRGRGQCLKREADAGSDVNHANGPAARTRGSAGFEEKEAKFEFPTNENAAIPAV
jgi:hypothetical protein